MKKIMAVVITLTMALGCALPVMAEDAEGMSLIVGVSTKMSGYFFTAKWGVNSADVDLRELIHGHNTISWEQTGDYAINKTVLDIEVEEIMDEETGEKIVDRIVKFDVRMSGRDKVYRIPFNKDLAYSDGTPITAWDYAFSALLLSSPEFTALGGAPTEMSWLLGYEAFCEGEPFAGVRVLDDYTLDLTIDGQYLPYFYEIVLLNITPYPISVLAPGCEVKDDGQGAYIEGPFSEELLRATILDEENGYLYKPTVAAGPYVLESYDGQAQEAKFRKNEYYAGNFEGVTPQIEELTVVYANPETALEDIKSGTLDLMNKISDALVIDTGIRDEALRFVNYYRTGLTFISFACEQGPTESVNVRKAVAHCVDRDGIQYLFTKDYGMPVYAYYGEGQWMAQENKPALEAYETMLDVDEAIRLLEADGWVLDEAGEAYDREVGGVRCRVGADGSLEKLALKWAQPEETRLSELLEQEVLLNLEAAGIAAQVERLPFDELLARYYRQMEREYDLFSLATNFNLAFDPYLTFHVEEEFQGESNKTGLQDEELMELALAMRQTPVRDVETYVERWLAFQDRFSELQPMVPLFSNEYFDFFRPDLQEYYSNAYFSWATAIVYSYIGEAPDIDLDDLFGD